MTMIDSLFNSSTIPLLANVAAFAERRHEALAGNVANISTPDYRTRDLPVAEFQAALDEAIAHRQPADGSGKPAWSFSAAARSSPVTEVFPRALFRPAAHAPEQERLTTSGSRASTWARSPACP